MAFFHTGTRRPTRVWNGSGAHWVRREVTPGLTPLGARYAGTGYALYVTFGFWGTAVAVACAGTSEGGPQHMSVISGYAGIG